MQGIEHRRHSHLYRMLTNVIESILIISYLINFFFESTKFRFNMHYKGPILRRGYVRILNHL